MLRLIAIAVAGLALAASAQALTPAPLPQPDGMITQVRFGCGPGRPVLLVSASPEPPSAIPVELTAGAITEEPRTFKAPHPVRAFGTSGRLDFAHLGNL